MLLKMKMAILQKYTCTYDPETKSGSGCTRKVKGTLHWVEASTAVDIESRLYDYLLKEDSDGKDFLGDFNHDSLQVFHSKGGSMSC